MPKPICRVEILYNGIYPVSFPNFACWHVGSLNWPHWEHLHHRYGQILKSTLYYFADDLDLE